jgi:hypothetical protein
LHVKFFYTGSDSKIGLCPGSALNLNQAKPAPKQPNFKKLGDAGGFILKNLHPERRRFFRRLMRRCGYRRLPRYHIACLDPPLRRDEIAASGAFNGYLTQAEPIFESRAV